MSLPQQVVDRMMSKDYFSQWLGIEVLEIKDGYCKLKMIVREEMLNGFGILHGGISFSLADSAFAFAANSYGRLSVSISSSISYPKPARTDDILIAEATELTLSNRTATYDIRVYNEESEDTIALFRGTVYRTDKTVL
jgi:acyl-CoA thioesterase